MEVSGGARRVPDWPEGDRETCCLSTIAITTRSGKQDHMDQVAYIAYWSLQLFCYYFYMKISHVSYICLYLYIFKISYALIRLF